MPELCILQIGRCWGFGLLAINQAQFTHAILESTAEGGVLEDGSCGVLFGEYT